MKREKEETSPERHAEYIYTSPPTHFHTTSVIKKCEYYCVQNDVL